MLSAQEAHQTQVRAVIIFLEHQLLVALELLLVLKEEIMMQAAQQVQA